uniref:Uncharacterized protein n=1 Tax=Glossina palpalis gambiensis TaxID=67801 RepID=A0A1B0BSZ0_9MUSC
MCLALCFRACVHYDCLMQDWAIGDDDDDDTVHSSDDDYGGGGSCVVIVEIHFQNTTVQTYLQFSTIKHLLCFVTKHPNPGNAIIIAIAMLLLYPVVFVIENRLLTIDDMNVTKAVRLAYCLA